jgi:hypothetical protein
MTDVVRQHVVHQHHSAPNSVSPLSAVLCDARVPLLETGAEVAWIQRRFAVGRSELDFLDDDGLG